MMKACKIIFRWDFNWNRRSSKHKRSTSWAIELTNLCKV